MLTAKDVYKQVERLTIDIIESSLCDAQNFPSLTYKAGGIAEVGINVSEQSIFLKNIPYAEMYGELLKRRQYNLKMIDGALVTLLYRFQNDELIAHRLSFFPAPNMEVFQNEPELYLEDELYMEFLDKRIVTVPLRFDFDSSDAFIPVEHPMSHLTLGQYENCRIPVYSGLTPYQFLDFVIRNFYHTAQSKNRHKLTRYPDKFTVSIMPDEQSLIHVHTPL